MISRLITIKTLWELLNYLSHLPILLTACDFVSFPHFEDVLCTQRLVRRDSLSWCTFYTWKRLIAYVLLQLTSLIPRPGHCSQFSLHPIIDRAMSQNLKAFKLPPVWSRQGFTLKLLSPVALHNSVTLHDDLTTLHNFVTSHDNSVALHNLVNQIGRTFTV